MIKLTLMLLLLLSSNAFACIDLGGNKAASTGMQTASNYVIFYEGTLESSDACTLDTKFKKGTLDKDALYYTDRTYTLTSVPDAYKGMAMVILPNNDRNNGSVSGYIKLNFPDFKALYVAYDIRNNPLPEWLKTFSDTGDSLFTSLSTQPSLKIYKVDIEPNGGTVRYARYVTFTFKHPTDNADGTPLKDLGGCEINWGSVSGEYTNSHDCGMETTCVMLMDQKETLYAVARCYDTTKSWLVKTGDGTVCQDDGWLNVTEQHILRRNFSVPTGEVTILPTDESKNFN